MPDNLTIFVSNGMFYDISNNAPVLLKQIPNIPNITVSDIVVFIHPLTNDSIWLFLGFSIFPGQCPLQDSCPNNFQIYDINLTAIRNGNSSSSTGINLLSTVQISPLLQGFTVSPDNSLLFVSQLVDEQDHEYGKLLCYNISDPTNPDFLKLRQSGIPSYMDLYVFESETNALLSYKLHIYHRLYKPQLIKSVAKSVGCGC